MEFKDNNISKIIFITGGTKSGKSEFAEYLGRKFKKITYIALSETRTEDINWQKKGQVIIKPKAFLKYLELHANPSNKKELVVLVKVVEGLHR